METLTTYFETKTKAGTFRKVSKKALEFRHQIAKIFLDVQELDPEIYNLEILHLCEIEDAMKYSLKHINIKPKEHKLCVVDNDFYMDDAFVCRIKDITTISSLKGSIIKYFYRNREKEYQGLTGMQRRVLAK